MKTKFVVLNLALVGGIGFVGWQAKVQWDDAQAKRNALVQQKVKPGIVPPPAMTPAPEAVTAVKYVDVAKKNLFSKDRDPNVVIEPPKAVEPPKPMPKLPVVYGVMGLPSGVKAVMAETAGSGTSVVKPGDTIGEFKVLALDTKNVTFQWKDTEVKRTIESLLDRGEKPMAGGGVSAVQANVSVPRPGGAAAPSSSGAVAVNPSLGAENGPSVRGCVPGENSPSGTVLDGYTKTIRVTPFGNQCRWVANAPAAK